MFIQLHKTQEAPVIWLHPKGEKVLPTRMGERDGRKKSYRNFTRWMMVILCAREVVTSQATLSEVMSRVFNEGNFRNFAFEKT